MKDRRLKRFWYRAGPIAAAGALLTGGTWMGCSSDSPTSSSTSGTGGSSDVTSSTTTMSGGTGGASTTSTASAGGAGTTSSSSGTGGMHDLVIGSAADGHRPFDATPSPDGAQVYFTADGANGLGVYKAPADGSAPTPVAVYPAAIDPANPFAAPFEPLAFIRCVRVTN